MIKYLGLLTFMLYKLFKVLVSHLLKVIRVHLENNVLFDWEIY